MDKGFKEMEQETPPLHACALVINRIFLEATDNCRCTCMHFSDAISGNMAIKSIYGEPIVPQRSYCTSCRTRVPGRNMNKDVSDKNGIGIKGNP